MFNILALFFLISGFGLLILLSWIDLKTYLLPNKYVLPFAILGPAFHFFTYFYYLDVMQIILGGATGYAILYVIRAAGNHYYGQDSLGLGDVKLLGAGGLWLGVEGVLFAMTIGAFFGLLHGLVFAAYKKIKTKGPYTIARLTIPAGPGFALGIIVVVLWNYQDFLQRSYALLFY